MFLIQVSGYLKYTSIEWNVSFLHPKMVVLFISFSIFFLIVSQVKKEFPRFVVIYTVKGFGMVSRAEMDMFLEKKKRKTVWRFLKKLKTQLLDDLAIPLLGVHVKNTKTLN